MTDNSTQLIFYILREKSEDTTKDFSDFIYSIKETYAFVDVISDSATSATLSGQNTYKVHLDHLIFDKPELFSGYSLCLRLTIGSEDYITFGKIRQFLTRFHDHYRVYSDQLKCLLPEDDDLVSLEFGSVNIKAFEILKKYSLRPVYFSQKNHLYYALSVDNKVHLVNPYLLEYIYDKNIPEKEFPELSYPVAPSLSFFSAMYDKDLVPTNFYEYFQKPTKIINKSNFDINNPGRKVFVKPYVFEFDDKLGNFYTYAGPGEGGSLLVMGKILKGETLDGTLKRMLREEIKIADDYMAALVTPKIEFDRDRDGILTPRLVVFVYVDQINDKNWAMQMSQTSWRSMNGDLPKINQNQEFVKKDQN